MLIVVFSVGCDKYTPGSTLTDAVEAHNQRRLLKKEGIEVDFTLFSAKGDSLKGTISWLSTTDKAFIQLEGGKILEFGSGIPSKEKFPKWVDRLAVERWPELLVLPFRLDHPKWRRSEYLNPKLNGKIFRVKKITVPDGDEPIHAPGDRLIYVDSKTDLLHAVVFMDGASVVPNGSPQAMVEYGDYEALDAILLARKWSFKSWNAKYGTGEVYGELLIDEVRFSLSDLPPHQRLVENPDE